MIVEPGFLDHWKTQLLIQLLGESAAPLYVIRLWGFCQQRRTDRHKVSAQTFAFICHYHTPDRATEFFDAMLTSGFIEKDGEEIVAHDWAKVNATLIGRWKGGETTQSRYSGIAKPRLSRGKAKAIRVDKSRVERSGEERNLKSSTQADNNPSSLPEKVKEKEGFLNRIRNFFHKRESTPLDNSERLAWEKAQPVVAATLPEEWSLLEWAYRQTGGDARQYRRHDMATLLNNWNCEIDRARGWQNGRSSTTDEYELKGYDKYSKEHY